MAKSNENIGSFESQLQNVEMQVERLGPIQEGNKFICIRYRCQGVEFDFLYVEENLVVEGTNYR